MSVTRHELTSPAWWQAATTRAAYTALAALLPLVGLLVTGQVADLWVVVLTVALALVASLATSLAGLPELGDREVPLWLAVLARCGRTAGQVLAASLAGAVLLTDVDWPTIGLQVAGAVLTTLVRTLMAALPETYPVLVAEADTGPTTVVNVIGASPAMTGDELRTAIDRAGNSGAW